MKYTVLHDGSVFLDGEVILQCSHKANPRSQNQPGVYNFAIEQLIANRFELDLSINSDVIHFLEIKLKISLLDFLKYGGFDESDDVYFVEDFSMRMSNYQNKDFQHRGNKSKKSTFLQKLSLLSQTKNNESDKSSSTKVRIKPSPKMQLSHHLTIGITVGNCCFLEDFLSSLLSSFEENLEKVSMIICCFGVDICSVRDTFSKLDLDPDMCIVLSEEWGHEQAKLGRLGNWFLTEDNCSGVSFGRCVLHRALYDFSVNEIIWILDDDIVFEKSNLQQLNQSIQNMEEGNFLVGIGAILGDAPLPPAYIIRTQAVDFFYANLTNSVIDWEIDQNNQSMHDIHHDLSTLRTDHLEVPIGLREAKKYDIHNWSIFSGKSITRQIHSDWHRLDKVPTRGGNTLILNRSPLIYWPNVAPNCGGIQFRRGDTLWARLIENENPELICPIPLSVKQIRPENSKSFGPTSSIRGDILGSMLTRLIGAEDYCASEIIKNSKIRESRLIMNLLRAHYLLGILSYNKQHLKVLYDFIFEIIKTPYSEQLQSDLSEFIGNQDEDIIHFRTID